MKSNILDITPVLPSADIKRDIHWYAKLGFKAISTNGMYAVLKRAHVYIHLQWHADSPDDPLNGGSVVKLFVQDIESIFQEFRETGVIGREALQRNTSWGTDEFGVFDLNQNAIFIVSKAN